MNSHCITFSHDAAEQSFDALGSDEMNDPAILCDTMQMVFVGPKGERDNLARAAFSSERVFLRSFALAQWARILSVCNKNYSHINLLVATKSGAKSFVQQCKNTMNDDSRLISNESDLKFENSVGDDTANVRTANESSAPDSDNNGTEDEIEGVTYTHVTNSLDSNHPDKESARSDFLNAAKDMFRTRKKKKHDIVIQARRGQDPFNEFYDNHTVITMAHPTVFLLGTLFGHDQETQGSLNRLDGNHILNQFTNAAATDQDLNFFMFDQDQRHSNTRGVVGKVRANKAAFDKFAEMYESKEFQRDLDHAVKNPSGKVAKDVIGKVLPVIRASGSKTTLSPLQSAQSVTKMLAMTRRYGPPSTFLTISPDDVNNPTSFRLCFRSISSNTEFPATASDDFFEKLAERSVFVTENNVRIPTDYTSLLRKAEENPVATSMEFHHAMLCAVFEALLGIPMNAIDNGAVKKTVHYALRKNQSKGLFGTLLAAYGVIEESRRRALHLHIVLFGVGCRPGCYRKLLLIHTFGKKSQKSLAPCTKLKFLGPITF